jgi:hypothetical protein
MTAKRNDRAAVLEEALAHLQDSAQTLSNTLLAELSDLSAEELTRFAG